MINNTEKNNDTIKKSKLQKRFSILSHLFNFLLGIMIVVLYNFNNLDEYKVTYEEINTELRPDCVIIEEPLSYEKFNGDKNLMLDHLVKKCGKNHYFGFNKKPIDFD